jgi:hypothetical protein
MHDAQPIRPLALLLSLFVAGCAAAERPAMGPDTTIEPPPSRLQPGVLRVTSALARDAPSVEVELRQVTGTGYEVRYLGGPMGEAHVPHAVAIGRPLCTLPCSVLVDGSQELFFTGPGLEATPPFALSADSGEVRFTVRPGSAARSAAGTTIAVLGGMSAAFGAVALPIGGATHSGGLAKLGAAMLIPGAVVLGTGIALVLTGRTTYVKRTAPLVW